MPMPQAFGCSLKKSSLGLEPSRSCWRLARAMSCATARGALGARDLIDPRQTARDARFGGKSLPRLRIRYATTRRLPVYSQSFVCSASCVGDV
jgi:hypothetical protein